MPEHGASRDCRRRDTPPPVSTATTPGAAKAAAVWIAASSAWACGERNIQATACPGKLRSSPKRPCPVKSRASSCRRTGCPTPARGMVEPALPAIVQRSFVCRTRPGERTRSPVIFEIAVITTSNGSLLSSFPGACILIFEIVVSISRRPSGVAFSRAATPIAFEISRSARTRQSRAHWPAPTG